VLFAWRNHRSQAPLTSVRILVKMAQSEPVACRYH
jgi:hypothetical protein